MCIGKLGMRSRRQRFWSDIDRIEIAQQARAARTQRKELAFNRTYPSSD